MQNQLLPEYKVYDFLLPYYQNVISSYPTLYTPGQLRFANHLFFVNGTGMEWCDKSGEYYGEITPNGEPPTKEELDSLDTTQSNIDWNEIITKKWDSEIVQFPPDKDPSIKKSLIKENIFNPICFYDISLDRFSLIGHIPKFVSDNTLKACAKTLLYALHMSSNKTPYANLYTGIVETIPIAVPNAYNKIYQHRYIPERTTINALYLIARYNEIFSKRKAWTDTINDLETIHPIYKGATSYHQLPQFYHKFKLDISYRHTPRKSKREYPYLNINKDNVSIQEYLLFFNLDVTNITEYAKLLIDYHWSNILKEKESLKL